MYWIQPTPLCCYQPLLCIMLQQATHHVCTCWGFICFWLIVYVTPSIIKHNAFFSEGKKKSLLDAASSPALSLVTNGHHFRVPNYINVSSGTGLPAYVILPAQFLPPTSLLFLRLLLLSLSLSLSIYLFVSLSLSQLAWYNVMWLGCLAAIPLFE